MIKHQCGNCGTEYEFSKNDKTWYTSNTICPKCTYSLNAQQTQKRRKDILEKGQNIIGGKRLNNEMVLFDDKGIYYI